MDNDPLLSAFNNVGLEDAFIVDFGSNSVITGAPTVVSELTGQIAEVFFDIPFLRDKNIVDVLISKFSTHGATILDYPIRQCQQNFDGF